MKRQNLARLVLVLSLAGYAYLCWHFVNSTGLPTLCPFKLVTGVPCPSCGITRSVVRLLDGDLTGSLLINPLGVLITIALLVMPAWIVADFVRGSDTFYRFYRSVEQTLSRSRRLSVSFAMVLLLNWCWNIMKGV